MVQAMWVNPYEGDLMGLKEYDAACDAVEAVVDAMPDVTHDELAKLREKAAAHDALVRKCDDRLGRAMRVLGQGASSGYRHDAPAAVLAAFDKLAR